MNILNKLSSIQRPAYTLRDHSIQSQIVIIIALLLTIRDARVAGHINVSVRGKEVHLLDF